MLTAGNLLCSPFPSPPSLPILVVVKSPVPSVLVITGSRSGQMLQMGLLSDGSCEWPGQSVQEDKAGVEDICLQKKKKMTDCHGLSRRWTHAGLYLLAWSQSCRCFSWVLFPFPHPSHGENAWKGDLDASQLPKGKALCFGPQLSNASSLNRLPPFKKKKYTTF